MNTPIGNTSFDYRYVNVKGTIVKRPVQRRRCNAFPSGQNFPGKSTDCRRLAGQLSHDDLRKNDDRKAREVNRGSREFDGRSIPEIGRDDAVDTMESPIHKELTCQTQASDSIKGSPQSVLTKLETTQNNRRLHEETTPSSCGIRLMSISTNVD
ncbi:hypothetical protein ALC57_11943 [Trachymyrmex cornetzi]|uniref:Uncharacterized protein n=1 Tax=Trachymyrmex cornetzi TaxID=471704 RepID=A0A195DSU0_9HYME|nr:hypothetical protein ALC57_11943 [Trachymyrmex cornetzi]